MFALLPLLGKKLDDLTLADLTKVKEVLKIDVNLTPELRDAGVALLKGANLDTVSDLVSSPESVQMLLQFLNSPQGAETVPDKNVVRCPHCSQFFF